MAISSSGPKNRPPSGIHGRGVATSSADCQAAIFSLSPSSSYAAALPGSSPSSSAMNASDSAEAMKFTNAVAASAFDSSMPE